MTTVHPLDSLHKEEKGKCDHECRNSDENEDWGLRRKKDQDMPDEKFGGIGLSFLRFYSFRCSHLGLR